MNKKIVSKIKVVTSAYLVLTLLILMGGIGFLPKTVGAASLTALSDTMSTSQKDALSSHVIKFTTPTGAEQRTDTIIITFPSEFDLSSKAISSVTFTHGATTGAES